jgi:hypothetical protein
MRQSYFSPFWKRLGLRFPVARHFSLVHVQLCVLSLLAFDLSPFSAIGLLQGLLQRFAPVQTIGYCKFQC